GDVGIALDGDVDRLHILAVDVQRRLVDAGQHERRVVAAAAEPAATAAFTAGAAATPGAPRRRRQRLQRLFAKIPLHDVEAGLVAIVKILTADLADDV